MSVRNASSSIYCDHIDAQKWLLVSVNKTPQAELCSSLSKARLQVVDQELLQYFISSPCISYNKTFYLKLNMWAKILLTHITLISMRIFGFLLVLVSWEIEQFIKHHLPIRCSTLHPEIFSKKIFWIKTSSSNDALKSLKVYGSLPRPLHAFFHLLLKRLLWSSW